MLYTAQQLKQQRKVTGNTFRKRVQYNVDQQKLFPVVKGVYATQPIEAFGEENFAILGGLLYSPTYRSFETVLTKAGVTFQYTSSMIYAGPYSKEKIIGSQQYVYKRMPLSLLTWNVGLVRTNTGMEATLERALCDVLYWNPHYPLDRLPDSIDQHLLFRIADHYSTIKGQKNLPDRVLSLIQSYAD